MFLLDEQTENALIGGGEIVIEQIRGGAMMDSNSTRRQFIRTTTIISASLLLGGCRGGAGTNSQTRASNESSTKADENQMGGEVTATEDLMREHGVLRRALLVYTGAAVKLRANPSAIVKKLSSSRQSKRLVARLRLTRTFSSPSTIAGARSPITLLT